MKKKSFLPSLLCRRGEAKKEERKRKLGNRKREGEERDVGANPFFLTPSFFCFLKIRVRFKERFLCLVSQFLALLRFSVGRKCEFLSAVMGVLRQGVSQPLK